MNKLSVLLQNIGIFTLLFGAGMVFRGLGFQFPSLLLGFGILMIVATIGDVMLYKHGGLLRRVVYFGDEKDVIHDSRRLWKVYILRNGFELAVCVVGFLLAPVLHL